MKTRKFCGIKHEALGIESMIAKTNFTLGPIENSFFLLQLKWFTFSIKVYANLKM